MKRKALLLVVAMLIIGLLAGCGGRGDQGAATAAQTAAQGSVQGTAAEAPPAGYDGKDNLRVSEKPVEITLFYTFGNNGAPKGDMPAWEKAAEITNVTMQNVANESIPEEPQALSTMLASGELPDLIQGMRVNITPLIGQGAYIPLDDLITEYAPNIRKFLEDYPDAKRAGSGSDGKMYLITGTLGGEPGKNLPSMGLFIRKDWLDKLKLPVPTTFQEFKDTMYAFREKDPNGNNKKDEVPLFSRQPGIWPFIQFFGTQHEWFIGDDDKVHYGRADEPYRDAMAEMAQWYKDGVIDPEIFTRGSQARQFLLGNNLGGATVDWFASTGAMNDTVREQVPDISFVAIPPVADVNGKTRMVFGRESIHSYAWGISKDCKDPITAIKYMDFFFTKTGSDLMGLGIEGKSYTIENGEIVLTAEAKDNPAGYPNYLRSIGAGYEIGHYGSLLGEVVSMNKEAREGFELYEKSDWIAAPFPVLSFTDEEQNTIDKYLPDLDTYFKEIEQRWLMGAEDVRAGWDAHIRTIKNMHFQEVLDAYNSAYQRYKNS